MPSRDVPPCMPGRKQPRVSDSERKREYRMQQKRGKGEAGEDFGVREAGAEVANERETWKENKERLSRQDF